MGYRKRMIRAAITKKQADKLKGIADVVKERPQVVKNILEKDIQAGIMKCLELAGIQASITNADRTWGKGGGVRASKVPKGHPDVTCVLPVLVGDMLVGLAWYIEVKTESGSIKPEQKEKLTSLANAGALCTLARDVITVHEIVQRFKGKSWSIADKATYDRILDLTLNHRRTNAVRDEIKTLKMPPQTIL